MFDMSCWAKMMPRRIEDLKDSNYDELVGTAETTGLNEGVFAVAISVVQRERVERSHDKDEQLRIFCVRIVESVGPG